MTQRDSVNIASHLVRMAANHGDRTALCCPRRTLLPGGSAWSSHTFAELNEESDRLAAGLQAIGIRRGVRTVLMVPPSADFFALTFALFKVGAVLVLVDPGMGIRNLKQCLKEAEAEAFVGVPKAQLARRLFGWCRGTLRLVVHVGPRLGWSGYSLKQVRQTGARAARFSMSVMSADEMAAILFTSGSTGPPKGAVYTHGIFDSQLSSLKNTFGIQADEIDLCTFPLFALFAPALGMTAVIPKMDATRPAQVDPKNIIGPIREFKVTNLFGSPALLDRVGRYGVEHGVTLPTLRRVVSAGAPVHADVLDRFSKLLAPGSEIHTPYGATESLPVCTIGSSEILGETRLRTASGGGVCVGRPVDGMTVQVIRISDDAVPTWHDALAVPPGDIGEIVVKGPVVTRAYYNRPEATDLAKIRGENGDVYHRMGDVGYQDHQGRLWFCGRKSHRVITPSETLFTVPCEAIFNTHPDVRRTALVGVTQNGVTRPVLCVERETASRGKSTQVLTDELLATGRSHACTSLIDTVLFHDAFPVDIRHNSKIFREKLAVWATQKLAETMDTDRPAAVEQKASSR